MGERPLGMSIDRIDNNKGYCKQNCQWATRKQQNRNHRGNKMITIDGVTQCFQAWCDQLKLNCKKVEYRLRSGWDVKEAFEISPITHRQAMKIEIDGKTNSLRGWCKTYGICLSTVRYRINKGFSPNEVIMFVKNQKRQK